MKPTRRQRLQLRWQLEAEYARWMEFAMLCDSPKEAFFEGPFGEPFKNLRAGDCWCSGLCSLLSYLVGDNYRAGMRDRMLRNAPPNAHGVWWWPHTHKGWQARSRFCWKMAELCELEMQA